MTLGRVAAIAGYTWSGARRGKVAWVPAGLLGLTLLFQLPRIAHIHALFRSTGREGLAIAEYAALVGSFYRSWTLWGIGLALVFGVSSTGARGWRAAIAPILARPISRSEFIAGRLLGSAAVLILFWAVPALTLEGLRLALVPAVGLSPAAYVAPFALHVTVLSAGLALGTRVRPLIATFIGVAGLWGIYFVLEAPATAAVARWCLPPLDDLTRAAAPFAASSELAGLVALLAQTAAWIGAFAVIAAWSFEGLDLGSRDR